MLGLLNLIPLKDWAYGTIIVVLLSAFGYYTYHERQAGAQKEIAVVEKASAKQEVTEQKATATAQASETQASNLYDETNRAPPPASLPVECVRHDEGRVPVPHPGPAVGAAPAGQPAPDSAVGPEYNPSGAALERAKEADAQIAYLQARVTLLEKLIADANK